ncbi:MAG: hypothetical protein JO124_13315, partial [Hyphomicrobiales bacterium]|nr:hypothetical protein [Hyphomicrobiales bacterium]
SEYDTQGLTHQNGKRLEAEFDGFATLVEASPLVPAAPVARSHPTRAGDEKPPRAPKRKSFD